MRVPPVRAAAPAVLIATVFLITVELLRAANPLLDLAAGEIGVIGASRLALAIFAAPVLAGLAVAAAGAIRATAGVVAFLVVVRLVAQFQSPPALLVVGTGAAAGVAALVLALRQVPSGTAVPGVLLGTVADLAIRAGLGGWDPIFRPGVLPVLLTVAVAVAAIAALPLALPLRSRPDPDAGPPAGRAGVVGCYLALYLLAYGSAPVVAAHAAVALPVASLVLIATAAAGAELVRRMRPSDPESAAGQPRPGPGILLLLAATGGIAAMYWLAGPVVLAAVAAAGLAAAVLLARALTGTGPGPGPGPATGRGRRRAGTGYAAAGLAAGIGYVLPVMVYQVHYDLEFPFDNRFALVAAAAVLGWAGLGSLRPGPERVPGRWWRQPAGRLPARPAARLPARPVVAVLALLVPLLVPLGVVATRPAVPPPEQTGATVRLMSWNVMYGRHHTQGGVDLAGIAETIEAVDPDVLLLQEVSRGWPIGGGVDMAEWLARRLAMRYEWAPAADGLFGNALLTRLPSSDAEEERLPFVQGPMERSYVAATLHLDGGQELRVMNTHLQQRKENTRTRLVQSEALLDAWDGDPHTVIAGDFNFWPSWEEAGYWEAAGFVSAQDVTGHGSEFTSPSDDPDNRVDWIFGTPDLAFSEFAILTDVAVSDHFPLVVTVRVM